MPKLVASPPYSEIEPVTEFLHGVRIVDPYRWLEDQDSPRTREWIQAQQEYARSYLDAIPGRVRIKKRIRELLDVETYDSVQGVGQKLFFRKRLQGQEQFCIYCRQGIDGFDQLLLDPAKRGTGPHTAVKPLRVSPDGRLLLYEVKEGGERTGGFELLDIPSRKQLDDKLSRGYLRGFVFAPDGKGFFYVHEAVDSQRPFYRAAYHHILGTPPGKDREIFFAGEGEKIRLVLASDQKFLLFYVYHFTEKTLTDIYLEAFAATGSAKLLFSKIDCMLALRLVGEKILAITDREALNRKIVEIRLRENGEHEWVDLIPETNALITDWLVSGDKIYVSYVKEMIHRIVIFDFSGNELGEMPIASDETVRIIGGLPDLDGVLIEKEAFTEPIGIFLCSAKKNERTLWAKRNIPFDSGDYSYTQIWFTSKDGTRVPMYLVGRSDILIKTDSPTIMTSYGGHGVSMTPQFSVFASFLMERGCLLALPNIRGGSEFGIEWHKAATRRNHQTVFDDFLCAAEWLLESRKTAPGKLAIFGGSNSGLLVGAVLTQRPDLFNAVVCMAPMLDMLRYHLFDNAYVWKEEFGTAEDPDDFAALAKYSPYHQVRDGVAYPATMIVSGDADRNCNPLHARKMTARLQAANTSDHPIFLDYSKHRGHSPVLPLSERIEALTDRMAFLCHQFRLPA